MLIGGMQFSLLVIRGVGVICVIITVPENWPVPGTLQTAATDHFSTLRVIIGKSIHRENYDIRNILNNDEFALSTNHSRCEAAIFPEFKEMAIILVLVHITRVHDEGLSTILISLSEKKRTDEIVWSQLFCLGQGSLCAACHQKTGILIKI